MNKIAPISAALAAVVAVGSIASPAAAQTYRGFDDYRYSQACNDKKQQAAVAGTVLGAVAGAVLGSQVSGNGARTEGSVLGGVVGAALGNNIARSANKCAAATPPRGYYNSGYSQQYRQPAYGYGYGDRYDNRHDRRDRYDARYERSGYGYYGR